MSKPQLTNPTNEQELREQLADALRTGYHGIAETKVVNRVMQLIAADRKRVELEARLDELAEIPIHPNFIGEYIDDRIAKLKAQQEEV